jgi:hypothetical protein
MIGTIHDDERDALALMLACLGGDGEAGKVIGDNCDLAGVLAVVTGIALGVLTQAEGLDGAREWLEFFQRQAARAG